MTMFHANDRRSEEGPIVFSWSAGQLPSDGGRGRWRGDFWNEHVLVCCGRIFPPANAVRRASTGPLIDAVGGAILARHEQQRGVRYGDARGAEFLVRSRNFQYICAEIATDSALLPRAWPCADVVFAAAVGAGGARRTVPRCRPRRPFFASGGLKIC
jgi:hypothetical protein